MRTVKQLLDEKGHDVVSVAPDASVIDALRLMAEHGIGALVVLDGSRLAGVMSERDYARKVVLHGRSSAETRVKDIMSSQVHTVIPDDTVNACMLLMTQRRIRHLPVMDGGGVAGMLSIGDLVKAVIADQQEEISQLQQYIAG
ncbi:MAG: CBS domain-containing protein [Rhodanobacteraceae bacterium]|nr:CBS domain-containing protein [Rhodanobacteraceae bacterium]HPF74345.1 CBS domain-containing protein [Xanthomonadaceae bacterium]HRY00732.1 CBS domain-containing protein [Xanthomonadaceae bacterium]